MGGGAGAQPKAPLGSRSRLPPALTAGLAREVRVQPQRGSLISCGILLGFRPPPAPLPSPRLFAAIIRGEGEAFPAQVTGGKLRGQTGLRAVSAAAPAGP